MGSDWRATHGEAIFFAGSLVQARGAPRSASGSIAGFRHCARILFDLLEAEHSAVPPPAAVCRSSGNDLAVAAVHRLERASSLWIQNGYLRDVITTNGSHALYRPALPVDYAAERVAAHVPNHFDVGFEIGSAGTRVAVVRLLAGAEVRATHEVPLAPLLEAADRETSTLRASGGLGIRRHTQERCIGPLAAFFDSALAGRGRRGNGSAGPVRAAPSRF
jgi:hypothetical protein